MVIGTDLTPRYYSGVTPFDVTADDWLDLRSAARNPAGEQVLEYEVIRSESVLGGRSFSAGEMIRFILPTPEAVRNATHETRQFGAHNRGVLFFRLPAPGEVLTLSPDDVLDAIAEEIPATHEPVLELEDGGCAALHCADLTIGRLPRLSGKALVYRIVASGEFAYFLPETGVPIRVGSTGVLSFELPAFAGIDHVRLGRVVADRIPEFAIEVAE